MHRLRMIGAGALGVAVLLGFSGPSGAASPVLTATSQLVPAVQSGGVLVGFVTGGRQALYTASWTDQSTAAITNVLIVATFPAGSTLLAADPDVCSAPAPPSPTDPVVVSCPRETLRAGDTVTQQLFFRVPEVAAQTQAVVTSFLQGKEAGNDQNKSHTDTFPAPDRPVTIVPTAADAAGACTQVGDSPVATRSGLSAANPLITTATLTGPTGLLCTPVTLVERTRTNPTEGCGVGDTCTVDLSTTEAPEVSAPIGLTFTFLATNKNLTWYKNGIPVVDCAGATDLPAGLDACVTSRDKQGSGAVALGVLWRGGPDPTWTGR